MAIQTHPKLPVLDFSNEDSKPGSSSWLSARKEVCRALEEYGYFVAELGNKVPLELHNTMFGGLRELFDFPTETKAKVSSDQIKPFHGYRPVAQFERMLIDNATSPEKIQKLTNIFWPSGNDHFREVANSYVRLMAEVIQMVTRMLFENYGLEKYYGSHLESAIRTLSLLKCGRDKSETSTERTGIHTDKNFITIVNQDLLKGLEIKAKDGEWIAVQPSPSSFIVLAADGLQVWSNDRIKSCIHRANFTEGSTRYSLGMFEFHDGMLHVPEELVDEKHPLKYKPFDNFEFMESVRKEFLEGHGELSLKDYCGV